MSKKILRDSRGLFVKGTAGASPGRPKGTSFMDEFLQAKATVEKRKRKSLLVHFCERAYEDDRVLIACVDRILPALKSVEFIGSVDTSMTDELAASIQKKLAERYS